MFSLGTIIAMNDQETAKAAKAKKLPLVVSTAEEVDRMPPFPFPSIGNYEPEGWTPLDIWFVDSTGVGWSDELAHSVDSFKNIVKGFITQHSDETIGFAIIEAGEMQVHVQAFRKLKRGDHA